MSLDDVLSSILAPGPMLSFDSAASWWRDHLARTSAHTLPIDRAIVGATRVDRVGFAFAGGYAAALQAMVGGIDRGTLASFAATEEGGAHPRAIATTLVPDGDGFVLSGAKKWVTLGPEGGVVLVVAKVGEGDRPELRVARVDAKAAGVSIAALPEATFVPEIPHASIRFENVRVAATDVLPGDGYDTYLKPFRTTEDLHVHAALWAWLVAVGVRHGWPRELLARGAALVVTTRALATEPASSARVHVALGGVIEESKALVAALEPCWAGVDAPMRERWQRDRVILGVAGKARAARFAKAWEVVAAESAQRNA